MAIGTGGSLLPFGPGSKLWHYWMHVNVAWKASPHPWTTLNRLLRKAGVPRHMVNGLTQNLLQAAGLR